MIFGEAKLDLLEDSTKTKIAAHDNHCMERRKTHAKLKSKPLWIASFPGSGAELFLQLLTSVTEQPTLDAGVAPTLCKTGKAVACKTHWPAMQSPFPDPALQQQGRKHHHQNQHENVIVLVRNPADSIPSWYNQIYEARVGADFHSLQAPAKNWKRFANSKSHNGIQLKIQQWSNLIVYWLESPLYTVQQFVPFEHLVNATTGPTVLGQVVQTLHSSHVSTVVSSYDNDDATPNNDNASNDNATSIIQCIWKDTVLGQAALKRSHHDYQPSFTRAQQTNMLEALDALILRISDGGYPTRNDLLQVLRGYRYEIETNLAIEDN